MSKKIWIPITIVIVLALAAGGVAYAAESQQTQAITLPGGAGYGQITSIGNNQFTVKNSSGEHAVQVDANTRFVTPDGQTRSFSDLKAGNWVIGRVNKNGQSLVARQVILLPDGFDPSKINLKAAGKVTVVDLAAGTFTVKTVKNGDKTFTVNTSTVYLGVKGLNDLKVGMSAAVGAQDQGNGSLLTILVAARQPLTRNIGKITAVDETTNTFAIHTVKGEDLTFLVDASTHYKGIFASIKSLADLKPGLRVLVASQMDANGNRIAVNVTATTLGRLPRFNLLLGGQVASIGQNSFVLRTADNRGQSFQVSNATRIRQPGKGQVGLDALQPGMRVVVGARDLGGGQFLAQVVLIGGGKTPQTPPATTTPSGE